MDTGVLNISDGNAIKTTSIYSGRFLRTHADAAGNVGYTGIGFQPRGIVFFTDMDNIAGGASWGTAANGSTDACFVDYSVNVNNQYVNSNTNPIFSYTAVGVYSTASIASYDSDGFTLTWSKGGSPSGTISVLFLAFK